MEKLFKILQPKTDFLAGIQGNLDQGGVIIAITGVVLFVVMILAQIVLS